MEYCCVTLAGAVQSSLTSLDRVQKRLGGLVGNELFLSLQHLFHRRNVASLSLLYPCFNGKTFWQSISFSFISSDFYSKESAWHVHGCESSSFLSYSICKKKKRKEIPGRHLLFENEYFMDDSPDRMLSLSIPLQIKSQPLSVLHILIICTSYCSTTTSFRNAGWFLGIELSLE